MQSTIGVIGDVNLFGLQPTGMYDHLKVVSCARVVFCAHPC